MTSNLVSKQLQQALPNISRSKGNQTMKLGQRIEYNRINIFFFRSYTDNKAGRLVPDLYLFFVFLKKKKLNIR